MSAQNGFTLVELIVTSAISLVLGGLILTVFLVNSDQIEETTAMLRMSQRYGVAAEQIKRVARASKLVTTIDDVPCALAPPIAGFAATENLNSVFFCGIANEILGGYRIRSSLNRAFLEEWNTATNAWAPFTVSLNDSVVLQNTSTSYFRILAEREGIQFHLVLRQDVAGIPAYLSTKSERVVCRNADP